METTAADAFSFSFDDLVTKARSLGLPFWRGFMTGGLTTFVVVFMPSVILLG